MVTASRIQLDQPFVPEISKSVFILLMRSISRADTLLFSREMPTANCFVSSAYQLFVPFSVFFYSLLISHVVNTIQV